MKTTDYFKDYVLKRRPYLKTKWIEFVISEPIHKEVQQNKRIRYWGFIKEANK